MTRSITEITSGKNVQDLRAESVLMLKKTGIPFIQKGLELKPGQIKSHGRRNDCAEYISKCESELEKSRKPVRTVETVRAVKATVEPKREPEIEPKVESAVEPKVESAVEPKVESAVEPKVEPTVESVVKPKVEATAEATAEATVEPETNYSESEAEKLAIAKRLYFATAVKDDLTGLREYQLNLCKSGKYFLPEFAILVARTRVIIENYADSKSPDDKAHPGSIQKIRVDVMKYLADIVKPEIDKFPPVNDRTLKDTFEDFESSVRGAFGDIGKAKYELNRKKNELAEDDVRAIKVAPFIEWAVNQVRNLPESPARWREVAIAVMLLTGRRQSEVMSSGIFTYVDESHVVFEGQLKRHVAELVEPENIPVLGKSAKSIVEAVEWLEKHGKRTLPPKERTVEGIQKAAKDSHNRCSRYIAEAMDRLVGYCEILNGKDWAVTEKGKVVNKFKGHLCRQIYAQVCSGLFHDSNETKKRAYISRILLENRDAALIYDRDIEIKDWEELSELCGSLTD